MYSEFKYIDGKVYKAKNILVKFEDEYGNKHSIDLSQGINDIEMKYELNKIFINLEVK